MSRIPDYKNAVVVSPDAGGAKRATKVADALGMDFALIHKVISTICCRLFQERRLDKGHVREPTGVTGLMLVGSVSGKVAVLIDDLADVQPISPLLTIDCSNTGPSRPTPSSIRCDKSLRPPNPRYSLLLRHRPHQRILYR
jgi:hypothetical protein